MILMKARNALIILVFAIIIGVGIRKYPTEFNHYITNILEITRLKIFLNHPRQLMNMI